LIVNVKGLKSVKDQRQITLLYSLAVFIGCLPREDAVFRSTLHALQKDEDSCWNWFTIVRIKCWGRLWSL